MERLRVLGGRQRVLRRSDSESTPTTEPASTTGAALTLAWARRPAASASGQSGSCVTTVRVIRSFTFMSFITASRGGPWSAKPQKRVRHNDLVERLPVEGARLELQPVELAARRAPVLGPGGRLQAVRGDHQL